jgi:ribokinase
MPVDSHLSIARHVRASDAGAAWLQVDSPWYDERDLTFDHARPLFSQIDAILPSEDDVQKAYPGTDVQQGVIRILQAGAKLVVLKQGSEGCTILRTDGSKRTIPVLPSNVVDLTGAGDAFCGGFLAGMVLTGDVVTAASYGTVSSSFAIEGPGISRLLAATPAEASERLARFRQNS